jgi:prepilin-type N-terminal cleavage/methylation domain-containing protein
MKLPSASRSPKGFTLIELVVVIMIMGLLVGFGYASYREFARRQMVNGAVIQLRSNLRLAQQLALSGKKPESGCNTLNSYQFYLNYSVNPDQYEIRPRCDGSEYSLITKTVIFPNGVHFSSTTGLSGSLRFNVLGRGVVISGGSSPTVITVGFIGHLTGACAATPTTCMGQWLNTQTVTVTEAGEIF